MKPVVSGMGLTWHGQHAKIKANTGRWGVLELRIPSAGGMQDMLCMPLRKLPGWLSGIEAGKVKSPEARAKVIQYQNECDDVLWKYWNDGLAINPRAYSVNPGDVLTKEQQDVLRQLVTTTVDRLPKPKQGGAAVKMWSKLKAHFGVAYREIPQAEFTEAVSLLTRASTEWELVDDAVEDVQQDLGQTLRQELERTRWMLTMQRGAMTLTEIPSGSIVLAPEGVAKMVREPGAVPIGMIPDVLQACASRLQGVERSGRA